MSLHWGWPEVAAVRAKRLDQRNAELEREARSLATRAVLLYAWR
jgi:hypothetical protein